MKTFSVLREFKKLVRNFFVLTKHPVIKLKFSSLVYNFLVFVLQLFLGSLPVRQWMLSLYCIVNQHFGAPSATMSLELVSEKLSMHHNHQLLLTVLQVQNRHKILKMRALITG